ncbi:hypothetical protein M406DRAFT_333151 [Cryphonectria parasitica EP155]|uniref:Uncharacterized protein n=1 Tax=Cryphonectria parasitica (strain ATCC 38755 / EP155) TaxID=660469 RepID=A0A9P4XYB9_CRYP1|nr:uncharacterized protein M406DRAFT_333151 [Cryphonectria parasitica EP155]KAF3762780.1 hypothetical protein M406DRAFT_333151 [Cryphonectria parasitica EP155]
MTRERPLGPYLQPNKLFCPSQEDSSGKTQPIPSWQDVLELISNAEEQYKDKGEKNKARRALRKGQDVANVLNGLVELIPDEHGLGVLRVALSKIFTGWIDKIKNREKVLSALGDIPITLSVALERWHSFKTDEQLKKATRQLYDDCMNAIRRLIDILNHKQGSISKTQRVCFVLKQAIPSHDEAKIDEILATVTNAKKTVDNNVDRLDRMRAADTHYNTEFAAYQAIATHQAIGDTKGRIMDVDMHIQTQHQETTAQLGQLEARVEASIQKAGSDFSARFSNIESQLATMQATFEANSMGGVGQIPLVLMEFMQRTELMYTSLYYISNEQAWKQSLQPILPRTASPNPRSPFTTVTLEQLIDLIGIQPLSIVEDRDTVLRKGQTMPPNLLGRGRYLLTRPRFQDSLASQASDVLLVDGHCKEDCEGKISPISVFCASLAAMMMHNPACMVLHFFAGQHCLGDDDPTRGPQGLMRSLICQVLLYPNQPQPYLDWLTDQTFIKDVADNNINALCYLLKELLLRTRSGPTWEPCCQAFDDERREEHEACGAYQPITTLVIASR